MVHSFTVSLCKGVNSAIDNLLRICWLLEGAKFDERYGNIQGCR